MKSHYIDVRDVRPDDEIVLMNQRLVFKVTSVSNQSPSEITLRGLQLRFWNVFWEDCTLTLPTDSRALLVDRPPG